MNKKDLFAYVVSRKSSKPARSAKTALIWFGIIFSMTFLVIAFGMMVTGYDVIHPVRWATCVLIAALPLAIGMGYSVINDKIK